jgi:tRNA threonylcarbamoyladenosine biosynthesis protein TsaB
VSGSILAVDTTGEIGSIALIRDGVVIEEVPLESTDGFAHVLFVGIEALLARHAVGITDIDVFASASGPGSFTGVRVGLTAVKGLAEATGRKAIAISNLQALASFGTRPLRAIVIDARRGEVYAAVYDAALELVSDEVVTNAGKWLATLGDGQLEFITRGFYIDRSPSLEASGPLAGAIGKIAASKPELAKDPADIDANYVRRSDAELLWRE